MRKATKIWLIAAIAFVLIGCVIFGGAMTMLKWNFKKLSTARYETNRYDISTEYRSVSVKTNEADVFFVSSDTEDSSVICYEQSQMKHSVSVKDGTLVIEVKDTRRWYEKIGIYFETPKLTVSIPEGQYKALAVHSDTGDVDVPKVLAFESIEVLTSTGDIKMRASASEGVTLGSDTGDIDVKEISAGSLSLSVTTGDISALSVVCEGNAEIRVSTGKTKLKDVLCRTLTSYGSTGDIRLESVIASEKISIERDTGDVKFDACDAEEIFVTTSTGDVEGSLLSEKIFLAESDTGRVDVPKTVSGGQCEVTTDTGRIQLSVSNND